MGPARGAARAARTLVALALATAMVRAGGLTALVRAPHPTAHGSGVTWDLLNEVRADAARPSEWKIAGIQAYDEARTALRLRVPDRVAYPVDIPPGALLDFGWTVHAFVFTRPVPRQTVPTRLRVHLQHQDGRQAVLYEQVLNPRDVAGDQRWVDARVPLDAWSGWRGTLSFEITPLEAEVPPPVTAQLSAPRILVAPDPRSWNLLFITIDCLRADHVGAYGYPRKTTPTLDTIAAEGVRFAHAYSNAPMTLPSLPQIFTSSVFPEPGQESLITPIASGGIPSLAVVNNVWLVLWLNWARHPTRPDTFDRLVSGNLNAELISDTALAWVRARRDDRFVLYLHYLDAHSPYQAPPPYPRLFRDPTYRGPVGVVWDDTPGANAGRYDAADKAAITALYDGGIRYIDDQIGRLLAELRTSGVLDRTLVVVGADHGEELWDHGGYFHGQSLYDELLHVPLLVRFPDGAHAGRVVNRQVRSIDIAPSIATWLGLPPPASFEGRPLDAAIAAPDEPGDDLVATATVPQFPTRYALRTPAAKLIDSLDATDPSLHDLGADPAERVDVRSSQPALAAALGERLGVARRILGRTGYHARVVAAPGSARRFRLHLETPGDAGTFTNLGRGQGTAALTIVSSPDGRAITVEGSTDPDGRMFRFDRKLRGMVLRRGGVDVIDYTAQIDGAPAELSVQQGSAGVPSQPGRIDMLQPSLEATAPPPCPPPAGGLRLCVWRYPAALAPATPAGIDDAARERLRALGYVQ